MKSNLFLSAFLVLASACATAPAPAPITPDPVKPPGHWEMNVADEEVTAPPPPVNAHETDKPNVASNAKRSLFALPKKTLPEKNEAQ